MPKKFTTGCLAKVTTQEEYDEVMLTVPKTKNPTSLADFGYTFNKEGKLVQASNGKPFAWLGQKHYDKLGDCLVEDIYKMLESQYNLERVQVPLNAKVGEDPCCPVFVSKDFATAETSVLLCQGSGAVRPGMWARALCINDSLSVGTIFTYLDAIQARGWGVLVLNPNENSKSSGTIPEPSSAKKGEEESVEDYWLSTPDSTWKAFARMKMLKEEEIPGNESPPDHMVYVWDNFVKPAANVKQVPIIAHSYGGKCTTNLFRARTNEVLDRVPGIVFTDAINDLSPADNKHVQAFMKTKVVNWVASDRKLDAKERSYSGCVEVSSGHTKHEWTSASCVTSAFRYLDQCTGKSTTTLAAATETTKKGEQKEEEKEEEQQEEKKEEEQQEEKKEEEQQEEKKEEVKAEEEK